jgi:hypothetical protein
MFKQTPQQQQWFNNGVYIKYNKKDHFIRKCGITQGKLLGFKNKA